MVLTSGCLVRTDKIDINEIILDKHCPSHHNLYIDIVSQMVLDFFYSWYFYVKYSIILNSDLYKGLTNYYTRIGIKSFNTLIYYVEVKDKLTTSISGTNDYSHNRLLQGKCPNSSSPKNFSSNDRNKNTLLFITDGVLTIWLTSVPH